MKGSVKQIVESLKPGEIPQIAERSLFTVTKNQIDGSIVPCSRAAFVFTPSLGSLFQLVYEFFLIRRPIMSVVVDDKTEQRADDVIIRGTTWAAIWHMSWPLLLNMFTISIASFADVWVAGKLGSDTQAAIGICGQIGFFMIMLAVALSAGTTALVSRFWGAGDFKGAVEAARYSLIFRLYCSALFSAS